MNSMLPRIAAILLIVAGAVALAAPHDSFTWWEVWGTWALRPTLYIASTTGWLGLALSVALVTRAWGNPAARALTVALCSAAIAWGTTIANDAFTGWEFLVPAVRWQLALSSTAWCFASAGFMRFCATFPNDIGVERLGKLWDEQRARFRASGRFDDADPNNPLDLVDAPARWVARVLQGLLGAARYQRMAEWRFAHDIDFIRQWSDRWESRAWVALAVSPWRFAAMAALLAASFALAGNWFVPFLTTLLVGVWGPTIGMSTLRLSFRDADGEARRRALWVLAGVLAAFVLIALYVPAILLCAWIDSPALGLGLQPLLLACAALVLVISLVIAIFGSGALDPALAIQRTLVAGIVTTLVTFLFALVEATVATLLADRLGLPASAAPAIASAAVAVALGPMWKRISVLVGTRIGGIVPVHN